MARVAEFEAIIPLVHPVIVAALVSEETLNTVSSKCCS
ncbi:hypothetical protein PRUB_a0461 [Pseudoalteromonas rubra]|uniref:Uncharacterized protein n=1 Tax=Pseudoalteromonas rubra TaxID=43658 RepID=A0A8T0C5K8_9GAMM|nr:hypothetical protein PRUB_a0461 [Pseudoalteromonas rubra]